MSTYEELLEEARTKVQSFQRSTAEEYVPKMYQKLRDENPELAPKDARDRIENDCCGRIWKKRTILNALPDEAKDPKKRKAGCLRQKKPKSAAFSAAQSEKKKLIAVDTRGNSYSEDMGASIEPDDKRNPDILNENNSKLPKSDLLEFEFPLVFRDLQQHMAQLYSKIGDTGKVWFSGIINKNNGKVIRAQTGRKKMNNEAQTFGFVDRKMGVSHDDDTFDDIDNLI